MKSSCCLWNVVFALYDWGISSVRILLFHFQGSMCLACASPHSSQILSSWRQDTMPPTSSLCASPTTPASTLPVMKTLSLWMTSALGLIQQQSTLAGQRAVYVSDCSSSTCMIMPKNNLNLEQALHTILSLWLLSQCEMALWCCEQEKM